MNQPTHIFKMTPGAFTAFITTAFFFGLVSGITVAFWIVALIQNQ